MTPEEMLRLGIERDKQGDLAEAERLFGVAAEAGNVEAMNRYGVLLGKQGDSAGAEEWYRKAAATGNATGAYNVADVLRQRGDYAQAEKWYRKAADGGDKDAVRGLAITLQELGRLDEAGEQYIKAAGFGDAGAMNRYGVLLGKQGDSAGAEEWYRKAAATGDATGAYNVAFVLRQRGDYAEAEGWYRKADGGDVDAVFGLAVTLQKLGRPDEAEGLHHKAARSGHAAAMNHYGRSMERQGDVARAEEWYRKAAGKGDVDAMFNLGFMLRARGDTAEAEQWFRKAADMDDEQARYELACTLETLERFEEAEELLRAMAESGNDKAAERLAELSKRRPALSALYTYLLQIENAEGDWCNLRDPHTGELEFLDTVTADEKKLPEIAQGIMVKFGGELNCRVAFYLGDCTGRTKFEDGRYGYTVTGPERRIVGRNLADDNVYGIVGRGSDRSEPGPAHRRAAPAPTAPAAPSGDCTSHSPCRELLAMPAAERAPRLRLIIAKTSELGPDAITVYLNDELSAQLVVMGPGESGSLQRAFAVPAHLTPRWNTTPPDLLYRAVENMRGDRVEVNSHDQGDCSPLYTVVDQGVSGVAHLVRLEEALGTDLPHGAIIGIPRQHQILAIPIRKARDVATIEAMLRLVHDVGSKASDQLSLDVFWLHKGRLHPFHTEEKDGNLDRIFPPDEFRQLLEQLPRN